MKIAPIADVKARLSHYIEICGDSPVVVTKNGRPTAVLVAVSHDDDLERLVLWHTPRFRAMLDDADHRIQQGRYVGHRELWGSQRPRRKRKSSRLSRSRVGRQSLEIRTSARGAARGK